MMACERFSLKILILAVISTGIISVEGKCYRPLDLVAVVDSSGSVGDEQWHSQIEFVKGLVRNFDISSKNSHIGIVDYSQSAFIRADLNGETGKSKEKVSAALDSLLKKQQGGLSYTDRGLQAAVHLFRNLPKDRKLSKKVLLVLFDGWTTWRDGKTGVELMEKAISSLPGYNIARYAVTPNYPGLISKREELKLIASEDNHIYKISDLLSVVKSIKRQSEKACPVPSGKSKFKITKLPHSEKCDVTFVPVGCFNDKHGSPRPLPREILNDRDSSRSTFSGQYIQWKNWDNYLPDFICRCAKKAAKNNYKIIGVQYYGECWSSDDPKSYNSDGPSHENKCKTFGFKDCKYGSSYCTGTANHNFVYRVETKN